MPTENANQPCPICHLLISEHTVKELENCRSVISAEAKRLNDISWIFFSQQLIKEQPERLTNGRHCYKCGCHLPGKWGDGPAYPKVSGYPDAKMCGQCLREIPHNCHENVRHVSIQPTYMGSRDGQDYYECGICHRGIGVSEFVKVKEK